MEEVRLFRYPRHEDQRGWVAEAWRADWGLPAPLQDNLCWSDAGVLRGLHLQLSPMQGKFLTVLQGRIWDVAVNLETRRWQGFWLDAKEPAALWIPPGFAHGFYAVEPSLVWYKLDQPRNPESERVIAWDDPELGISWPLMGAPLLSERDRKGASCQAVAEDEERLKKGRSS